MNSYVSHRNPRDSRPNGYVTTATRACGPTGYVTHVPTPDFAGSYIDANTARPATRSLETV